MEEDLRDNLVLPFLAKALQKRGVDKMALHPAQVNLVCVQCWGIYHFPGEILPTADFSHWENFSPCV